MEYTEKKAYLLGLCAIIIWGTNYFVVQKGVQVAHPFVLTLLRLSMALPLMLFFRPKHSILKMLLATFIWNLGCFNLIALALSYGIAASAAAFLQQSNSLFLLLLSCLLLKEPLTRNKVFHIGVALIGIIIFFQPTLFSLEINIGGLFILLSAMTWAVGILLLKRFGIDGSLSTVIWMAGLAALLQAPLTFIIVPSQYLHLNMEAIFYALLSFLLSSIIANILWLKALSYTRNESLSQLILFMPVVVLIGDIFYVGATLHWYELIGGILIIGAGLSKFASLNKSKV